MNKKLIASLLTLGLVISPVARVVADESLEIEAASLKTYEEEIYEKTALIKAIVEDFEETKKSDVFRLASDDKKDNLSQVMKDASDYLSKSEVSLSELDGHINKIDAANKAVAESGKANLDNFKASIIKLESLLKNHEGKKDSEEYKKYSEDLAKAKDNLNREKLAELNGEDLIQLTKDLTDAFESYKKTLEDNNDYTASEDALNKLENEYNKTYETPADKDSKALKADRDTLIKTHENFIKSTNYTIAEESKKKAYDEAYKALASLKGEVEYDVLYKAVRDIAKAKSDIEGKDPDLNTVKPAPSAKEIEAKTIEVLNRLRAYITESDKVTKNLKDANLKNEYLANIAKAKAYAINYGIGIKRDLKTYQDLESKLKELKAKIEAQPTEKSKLDILKADLEKALKFKTTSDYITSEMDKQVKLNKAIENAREVLKKEEDKITDEEASLASKAINEALSAFDKFSDKDKARKAIKDLLDKTAGIKIDQIYTDKQKDAKNEYKKTRENATKLLDNKEASLDDLDKAYKEFKNSFDKLAVFLTSRLQKLVDDDQNFRSSKKYKEVDKESQNDSKKEKAIINYMGLVNQAKEELKKPAPDANLLNDLYRKLENARAEINGEISSEARELSDIIIDGRAYMDTQKYKNQAVSTNKTIKDAALNYKLLIETAEAYKKAGNFDSEETKDLIDAIKAARNLLDGKISEKAYLNNKYYHILNTLTKHKDYKTINQVSRERLEKALKLYRESTDEEKVFKALDEVMNDSSIKEFIKKVEDEKNPNLTRDKLLEDLTTLINQDKKLKEGGFKYQKAQKALRDAYDLALKEAKDLIANKEKPTEEEVRAAYKKLLNAKNNLDGDKFSDFIQNLAKRFKQDQLKIANPEDRKAIAAKINALAQDGMTMDDALRVEKELNDLINKKVVTTTTTLAPQGNTTTRPISTITNPGSSVRTGVTGIAKVGVVLLAALGIYKITSKKGDKNENN